MYMVNLQETTPINKPQTQNNVVDKAALLLCESVKSVVAASTSESPDKANPNQGTKSVDRLCCSFLHRKHSRIYIREDRATTEVCI